MYRIGVDLGGTNIASGVVNEQNEIIGRGKVKTRAPRPAAEIFDSIRESVALAVADAGISMDDVVSVGIGTPGSVNKDTGEIEFSNNLQFNNVPAKEMLEARLHKPVYLENDANCAALGEQVAGCGNGVSDFVAVTLGTGVGSGIVVDGKVLYGHDGFAGELGHVNVMRHNGRLCGCGKTGCLEAYCSAIGIARTAREWLEASGQPTLLRDIENLTSKDIYDAAKQGDNFALRLFDYTGTMLGRSFADFIAFSAPEAIVLFGGLARAKEFLYEPMLKAMNDNVMKIWKDKVKIVFSQLKESDAAILGASALAWEL
jgi:glucokinase